MRASIKVTAKLFTAPFGILIIMTQAQAQKGDVIRMICGDAGVVVASEGRHLEGDEYYFNVWSEGLRVGASGLTGIKNSQGLNINMEGYHIVFNPATKQYLFNYRSHNGRHGGDYLCAPL